MKLYNVFTKREFEDDGQRKIQWYRVGYVKRTEKGGRYLRLFHLPETEFVIYEQGVENADVK